jgi:hypothetical protein
VDNTVAVFNLNGMYYAIEDMCTHDGERRSPVANWKATKHFARDTARFR